MLYELEDLAKILKQARDAKGMSQRALSHLAGVPQSHLSKVEQGQVDLRLSSLIQIARVLDLEVKLVPKKAIPAVDTVVRSAIQHTLSPATPTAWEHIAKAQSAIATLERILPNLNEWPRLHTVLRELQHVAFTPETLRQLRTALRPYRKFADTHGDFLRVQSGITPVRGLLQQMSVFDARQLRALKIPQVTQLAAVTEQILHATTDLQALRNDIVHRRPAEVIVPTPAYTLDDEDDDA